MAANSPPSPTPSQLPPIPSSPTYSYASTANPLSQYNLPLPPPPRPAHAVLTKADLEQSQAAYADLLASAKSYRLALASLSTAASAFGSALESCARLKEARADSIGGPSAGASLSNSFTTKGSCTADTLLTVAGLQHLVANHQHILSETVYRAFEVPLLHELDKWRAAVDDEEEGYARAVAAQSREIRRLEKEGMKLHKQRRRDVAKFRGHLVELTTKLDGLTSLHGEHARTLLRESQETSARIVDASCSLVRAEVEIFESLAKKGWTGGGLEDVLEKGVDLFAAEMDPLAGSGKGGGADGGVGVGPGEGTKLFSILPPKSILADTSGPETLRGANHTRSDSLLMDADRYQSLAGAVSSDAARGRDRDTDSVFSDFNRSRNVRPFSPQPQPLRLNPEDLIESLENAGRESPSDSGKGEQEHQKLLRGHDRDGESTVEDELDQDEDDYEAHPWRNEGLRQETPSDDEEQDTVGASPRNSQQREESWSVPDVRA
ncbi:Phospholipid-binding protein [Madurella fahalii]|uniref:Phospholipid-binding protein n=1 Tax=Madurella fahalii TaxID=1157608 RepID=A0ABQ0G371_9PEZI